MRIMTSNIWGTYFGNEVEGRQDGLFSVYKKYAPDVIGFQEVNDGWYKSNLFERISKEYRIIGMEIFGSNEYYVPVAVKRTHRLISNGFEFLEDTPDKSKAITWAVIESDEGRFAVCNTHFWWMSGSESEKDKSMLAHSQVGQVAYQSKEEHDRRRVKNARQMVSLMKLLHSHYSCHVFAFGDMNTTISSDAFKVYRENGIDYLFDSAREKDTVCSIHGNPERGEDGKFHGKNPTKDYTSSIDHIIGLGNGYNVLCYRVIEDSEALDATDHSPVYADIELI